MWPKVALNPQCWVYSHVPQCEATHILKVTFLKSNYFKNTFSFKDYYGSPPPNTKLYSMQHISYRASARENLFAVDA